MKPGEWPGNPLEISSDMPQYIGWRAGPLTKVGNLTEDDLGFEDPPVARALHFAEPEGGAKESTVISIGSSAEVPVQRT